MMLGPGSACHQAYCRWRDLLPCARLHDDCSCRNDSPSLSRNGHLDFVARHHGVLSATAAAGKLGVACGWPRWITLALCFATVVGSVFLAEDVLQEIAMTYA
jgi:hypothetical protein